MVFPLHEFFGRIHHVITQIIEAKFVVCAVANSCTISRSTSGSIGRIFINALASNAIKLKNWSHPLGVTASQIVIDGYDMHAFSRQSIQKCRESCHQSFTFARCHFRNLAFVQSRPTDYLNIVMHHVPRRQIACRQPLVLPNRFITFNRYMRFTHCQLTVEVRSRNCNGIVFRKTASRFFDNRKGFWQNFEQNDFQLFVTL